MRRSRASDDDEEDLPLHRKKPFGAGLQRKKVEFVRAQEAQETSATSAARSKAAAAVGDLYASIVLGSSNSSSSSTPAATAVDGDGPADTEEPSICTVCGLLITTTISQHNASLAHQVSLEHSHPPSSLDRSRMGLKALQAHGWNPDARKGLGREGEGMRFPIKVATKEDNLGIGATAPEVKEKEVKMETKPLNGKELKAARAKERAKAESLQREIYGRTDVDKYLKGGGGEWE